MPPTFADPDTDALPIHFLTPDEVAPWLEDQPEATQRWAHVNAFKGAAGRVLVIPDAGGAAACALVGRGDPSSGRDRFAFSAARAALPAVTWRLEGVEDPAARDEAALGWLLAGYRFDRYRKRDEAAAELVPPEGCDRARLEAIAAGEVLTRDLINTPAADMGPDALQAACGELASAFGAGLTVTEGDALAEGFPLIHAVGRAASVPPRLIEITHGDSGPRLTLVGKGVCFDTGGLDIKPATSMALMKKDMGGAATVLGLAQMILTLGIPVRLRVLIPAVENAIGGAAFRPGDILTSRKGLTAEINNTDAEGRLVLADALALAVEDPPDLLVSMATLTGAARVAVGPDIAPFYTDDDAAAATLAEAAAEVRDPVWRLPFHAPYEPMIESGIADLDNAPKGGMAGSITAALFLRRFVGGARYMHFDVYGWQQAAAPARPKGGVGQGARALLQALPKLVSL